MPICENLGAADDTIQITFIAFCDNIQIVEQEGVLEREKERKREREYGDYIEKIYK